MNVESSAGAGTPDEPGVPRDIEACDVTEIHHANGRRTILVTDPSGKPIYIGPDRRDGEDPAGPERERRSSPRVWRTGPGLKRRPRRAA